MLKFYSYHQSFVYTEKSSQKAYCVISRDMRDLLRTIQCLSTIAVMEIKRFCCSSSCLGLWSKHQPCVLEELWFEDRHTVTSVKLTMAIPTSASKNVWLIDNKDVTGPNNTQVFPELQSRSVSTRTNWLKKGDNTEVKPYWVGNTRQLAHHLLSWRFVAVKTENGFLKTQISYFESTPRG